ncbi:hypothetical protein Tco_1201633, partial [Tanacetum coccineum]
MTKKETNEESVPTHSYDPSKSGEDGMQLHELMNLYTKLSDRVLTLETIKTTQVLEIASLKSRVKKLKKKASKITHKFKRLYRVGCTRRVESSNDEGKSDDIEMFDTDAIIGDEVFAKNDMIEKEHDVIPKEVSAAETLTTAGIKIPVSIAAPSTTVVLQEPVQNTVTTAPLTILKAKGITFRDAGETTTRTPTSDQIRLDEELERRLDAEEQEAARLERENVKLQEQATLAKTKEWDNVQAMMDANYCWELNLYHTKFGDSYKAPPEETGKGVEGSVKKKGRTVAITAEDIQKRKNDVKARTTLLLALPDEHQLRFTKYESAKELCEAILKTFGGNEATKKTKKNQLKQQYGNFKAEGSETLEQTFNRLQAIMSHLEFIDVPIEQDDLNQKFLTIYEPEVQKKGGSNPQNMAFISSSNTSSGKSRVPTASVQTASVQVPTASTDVAAACLSHDTICAFIATQPNGSQIKFE